jgi:hypothetical protein
MGSRCGTGRKDFPKPAILSGCQKKRFYHGLSGQTYNHQVKTCGIHIQDGASVKNVLEGEPDEFCLAVSCPGGQPAAGYCALQNYMYKNV